MVAGSFHNLCVLLTAFLSPAVGVVEATSTPEAVAPKGLSAAKDTPATHEAVEPESPSAKNLAPTPEAIAPEGLSAAPAPTPEGLSPANDASKPDGVNPAPTPDGVNPATSKDLPAPPTPEVVGPEHPSVAYAVPGTPAPAVPPPQPLSKTLRVVPGATCLQPDQLILQIKSWLDFEELDPRIAVEVQGDPVKPNVVVFSVRVDGSPSSTRTFDPAPSACLDLHAVVGLAVAMAIEVAVVESRKLDPLENMHTQPETSAPVPASSGERLKNPRVDPATAPPSTVVAPPPPQTSVRATAHGLVLIGLPTVAGGAQLGVDFQWPHPYSLRLQGLGGYRQGLTLGAGQLDVGIVAGRLDNCFGRAKAPQQVRTRVCLGLGGGGMVGRGRGFAGQNYQIWRPWLAGFVSLTTSIPLTKRFALELGVDALISIVRPEFLAVDPEGETAFSRSTTPFGVLAGFGGSFSLN